MTNYELSDTPAGGCYHKRCDQKTQPSVMTFEIVTPHDLMPHYGHRPSFSTVADAAMHLTAGSYIVAVEDGAMRALTPEEESQIARVNVL